MSSQLQTCFLLSVLASLTAGCVAEPMGSDPGDQLTGGKSDGYDFTRILDPAQVALDSEITANFDSDRYIAYEFDVPEAATLHIRSVPSVWRTIYASIAYAADYETSVVLFRVDESASPEDIYNRYDYVYDGAAHSSQSGWTNSHITLEYDVFTPGRYMALILGSPDCYEESLSVSTTIRQVSPLAERTPGYVQFTVYVAADNGILPAADLRIAVGTAEAYVDAEGHAFLDNVEAGEQDIRFGPSGLGRASLCKSVFVTGDGITDYQLCYIDAGSYSEWTS